MEFLITKYFHILFVILWVSATFSLFFWIFYAENKNINCDKLELRKFYRYMTNIEFLAFIGIISMGLRMFWLLSFPNLLWLNIKMSIVFGFFLPMELINFYFINIKLPKSNFDDSSWKSYKKFNLIVALPLFIAGLFVILLAVVRPT